MRKRILKLITSFSLVLMCLGLFATNVLAYDCASAFKDLDHWQAEEKKWCKIAPTGSPCISAKKHVGAAKTYIQQNGCNRVECTPSGYDYTETGYTDSRGWPIGRFHIPSGDEAFCIEPEVIFNMCAGYSKGGNPLPQDKRDRIARIVYGYNQTDKSNEHYVAAQLLIWDELGRHETANGSEMWGEKETILAKGRGESITVHKDVDLRDGDYIVNLGDKVTNPDNNGELH